MPTEISGDRSGRHQRRVHGRIFAEDIGDQRDYQEEGQGDYQDVHQPQ